MNKTLDTSDSNEDVVPSVVMQKEGDVFVDVPVVLSPANRRLVVDEIERVCFDGPDGARPGIGRGEDDGTASEFELFLGETVGGFSLELDPEDVRSSEFESGQHHPELLKLMNESVLDDQEPSEFELTLDDSGEAGAKQGIG